MITKELLINEYSLNNKRVVDIANNTGYSYSYVQSLIKKYKIKRRRHYNNIIGNVYDKLTVTEFSHVNDTGQSFWKCECKCGKYKIIRASSLVNGDTTSCGCNYILRIGELSRKHVHNIKNHAISRNLEFSLTDSEMWELYVVQNKKCKLSGIDIIFDINCPRNTTASLDRIDSSVGYITNNIQWVHKDVNKLKSDFNQEYFLKIIDKIHSYQHQK